MFVDGTNYLRLSGSGRLRRLRQSQQTVPLIYAIIETSSCLARGLRAVNTRLPDQQIMSYT